MKNTVEFQETVDELDRELENSNLWGGRLANSTMRTAILDAFALMLTSNQFHTEAAMMESFIQIARRTSSRYAGTLFLGVRIPRRMPAGVTASIYREDTDHFLSMYSHFSVDGKTFFNREARSFDQGDTYEMDLYEGIVRTKSFDVGEGETFLKLRMNEPNFVIAETDVQVEVEDLETETRTLWTRHDGSLLELTDDSQSYFDITDSDGDLVLMFGDGKYGKIPTGRVHVRYVVTSGIYANNSTSDLSVQRDGYSGHTTTAISGGAGVKDSQYFADYAPVAHRSKQGLSDFGSWKAAVMLYAGVADCTIQSQRHIAPNDKDWMSVVRVAVLPKYGSWGGAQGANPKSAKWEEFLEYMSSKTYLVIQPYNPRAIFAEIDVEVALNRGYSTDEWKSRIESDLRKLFERKDGTLGKRLSRTDISDIITLDEDGNRRREIDYVVVNSPTEDIVPASDLEYVQPREIKVRVKRSERKEIL